MYAVYFQFRTYTRKNRIDKFPSVFRESGEEYFAYLDAHTLYQFDGILCLRLREKRRRRHSDFNHPRNSFIADANAGKYILSIFGGNETVISVVTLIDYGNSVVLGIDEHIEVVIEKFKLRDRVLHRNDGNIEFLFSHDLAEFVF